MNEEAKQDKHSNKNSQTNKNKTLKKIKEQIDNTKFRKFLFRVKKDTKQRHDISNQAIIVTRSNKKYYLSQDLILYFYHKLHPFVQMIYRDISNKIRYDPLIVLEQVEKRFNELTRSYKEDINYTFTIKDVNEIKPVLTEQMKKEICHPNLPIERLPTLPQKDVALIKRVIEEICTPLGNNQKKVSSSEVSKARKVIQSIRLDPVFSDFIFNCNYGIVFNLKPIDKLFPPYTFTYEDIHTLCCEVDPESHKYFIHNIELSEFQISLNKEVFKSFDYKALKNQKKELKNKIQQETNNHSNEEKLSELKSQLRAIKQEIKTLLIETSFINEFMLVKHLQHIGNIFDPDLYDPIRKPVRPFEIHFKPLHFQLKFLKNHFKKLDATSFSQIKDFILALLNISFDEQTKRIDDWLSSNGIHIPSIFIDKKTNAIIQTPVFYNNEFMEETTFEELRSQQTSLIAQAANFGKGAADVLKDITKSRFEGSGEANAVDDHWMHRQYPENNVVLDKKDKTYVKQIQWFKRALEDFKKLLGPFYPYLTKDIYDVLVR